MVTFFWSSPTSGYQPGGLSLVPERQKPRAGIHSFQEPQYGNREIFRALLSTRMLSQALGQVANFTKYLIAQFVWIVLRKIIT